MTTLALPLPAAPPASSRSATHKLALALVWLTVASGAVVFSEPAPVDVLTDGPRRAAAGDRPCRHLAVADRAAGPDAGRRRRRRSWRPPRHRLALAATHTGVSLYLYVATFMFAAFVAKRPEAHARLILNAYTWAAFAAALAGHRRLLRPPPGRARAHDALGPRHRALQRPQRVRAVPGAGAGLRAEPARRRRRCARPSPLGVLLVLGLAILLSFSRGAWFNLAVAAAIYGALHMLTAATTGCG